MDSISLPLLLPTVLGLSALGMWTATLFMFRPKAKLQFKEEAIVLKVTNAKILRIERLKDEVVVHLDREVVRAVDSLAA
jgi:hypothetical protein